MPDPATDPKAFVDWSALRKNTLWQWLLDKVTNSVISLKDWLGTSDYISEWLGLREEDHAAHVLRRRQHVSQLLFFTGSNSEGSSEDRVPGNLDHSSRRAAEHCTYSAEVRGY